MHQYIIYPIHVLGTYILSFPSTSHACSNLMDNGHLCFIFRWFRQLNLYYKVRGHGFYLYKPRGKNRTPGVSASMALTSLKKGLAGESMAYIYHCQNHYFCPIGYEDVPLKALDAYRYYWVMHNLFCETLCNFFFSGLLGYM